MNHFFSTRQVGQILNIKPDLISKAIWSNRLQSPAKSPSGNFLWVKADIERAAWVLHRSKEFKTWESIASKNPPKEPTTLPTVNVYEQGN